MQINTLPLICMRRDCFVPRKDVVIGLILNKNPRLKNSQGFLIPPLRGIGGNYFTSSKSTSVTVSALPSAWPPAPAPPSPGWPC
jgi:hypothetical protein